MLRFILLPVLALILVVGQVHAQTPYTWASAANGNWNVGGNWNPAAIPGVLDTALINATGSNYTVTLSDTQSIKDLTINSANATFSHSGTLNLGGTLTLSSGVYKQTGASGTNGINGGQIVTTNGMRLSASGISVLNNVTLGNAANPDVIAIDNNSRNWWFYGSTDFQTGFVPNIGINGDLAFQTPRVLNTGYNLNAASLSSNTIGSAVTLKAGNVITASGSDNYIKGFGNWNIDGTVKTSDTGSTTLYFSAGSPSTRTIGTTGSVIAGTSSGTSLIIFTNTGASSIHVDGTIRANSGGRIDISSGQGGSQVFSSSSQLIADGGAIYIYQNNFNIDGTLTMMNGGIISMPSGTTNYTNKGILKVETTTPTAPSKMEVGSTPASTVQNPGTIIISVDSSIIIGGGTGTLNTPGTTTNNGTIGGNVLVPSGGTISGGGTIGGGVIINPGAIMLPGNSPGKMTLQKGLTLGGQYGWELGSSTEAGPGTNFDQIVVTAGNVVINSTASLKLTLPGGGTSDPFWASNHSWEILDNTGAGTTSGFFDVSQIIGAAQPNGSFSTSLVGNDLFLNWSVAAVPEPATWAMIAVTGLGAGGVYRLRQRRERQRFGARV